LENMCAQYGAIATTKAIMDKATNTCKGYGFVDFDTATAADAAMKGLNQQGIQAQMAKIRPSHPTHMASSSPSVEQDPTNLYIANLPADCTDTQLADMLNAYGLVISTRILRNVDSSSRGVGFARMESREKCEQIIQALNNKPPPGYAPSTPQLQVKFADSGKKPRQKQIYQGTLDPYIAVNNDMSGGGAMALNGVNLHHGVFAGGAGPFAGGGAQYQPSPYNAFMPQHQYMAAPPHMHMHSQPTYSAAYSASPMNATQEQVNRLAGHFGHMSFEQQFTPHQYHMTAPTTGGYMPFAPTYLSSAHMHQPQFLMAGQVDGMMNNGLSATYDQSAHVEYNAYAQPPPTHMQPPPSIQPPPSK